ncbi:hypothetical protein KVR01_010997 [Diaporthe batatas]|uniref:uncharacterized protein n=1 Tax=Diaporthe batatas TaxID=748121 RepID=UPI001D04D4D0|nr:uncharacterized protein KVR01_010997 [Diaporthe batatas]KAG8159336.1 hypothetical protein KVR01_010997 [Diaporthe batatas]
MSPQPPDRAPFTEDPAKERLTEYVEFITTSYSPSFCEHKVKDGEMRIIGDKGDMICLNSEKKEKGEGSIYQKDLFTFFYRHLGREQPESKQKQEDAPSHGQEGLEDPKKQWNRRGYWLIEVADGPPETSPPLPVFQFATCCLEVYPAEKGVIKLGTDDVAHILRSCTESKGGWMMIAVGKKMMPKLSGLAASQADDRNQVRFRWCLRGPTILDDGDESGGMFRKENLKSLFRKGDSSN